MKRESQANGARNERAGTVERKRDILNAALACFASKGYDATTLADIRERAGASTGSIYHHFKNKAELAAELYLEGVRSTQSHGLAALLAHPDAQSGVRALVAAYLDWVAEQPELARFLFAMRRAEFMEPVEARLAQMNRDTFATSSAWFRERIAAGELPRVSPSVFRAILYGPASHYARHWLRGDSEGDLDEAKQQLSAAAYAALQALQSTAARRTQRKGGGSKARKQAQPPARDARRARA
jgi:AcrR family transcriptional regulator